MQIDDDAAGFRPTMPKASTTSSRALIKPKKSNAQRGREFRAREKQRFRALYSAIHSLRKELMDLESIKSLREEQLHSCLVRRNTSDGSIAKLIHAYFSLFASGTPLNAENHRFDQQLVQQQVSFVHTVMDPACELIDANGLLDQWRRYTGYHASFHADVRFIQMLGGEERPVVRVGLDLTVNLSNSTFRHIFPHIAATDREFLEQHIGRTVVYQAVNTFTFSPEGRILMYETDVDFVSSFSNAGMSLEDIAKLLNQARISDHACLGNDDSSSDSNADGESVGSDIVEVNSKVNPKPATQKCIPDHPRTCQPLDLAFILG